MFWINEGFVLDAAGKLVATSYFDLRNKGYRTFMPGLPGTVLLLAG